MPNLNEDLYIENTQGDTVEIVLDGSLNAQQIDGVGKTLFIGSGAANKATVKFISKENDRHGWMHIDGSISVGSQQGNGSLAYYYDANTLDSNVVFQDFNIGSGLNSEGNVSLTGSGKSSSEHYIQKSGLSTYSLHIASDGAKGVLTVDGGSLEVDITNLPRKPIAFSLGSGTNSGVVSDGTMHVLGGGKVLVSPSHDNAERISPAAVISADGGRGVLNISGITMKDNEAIQSSVYFASGVEVGKNTASVGQINVMAGGLLATMAANGDDSNIGAYVGVNGGNGSIIISGEDSVWQVSGLTSYVSLVIKNQVGHLSIGESGNGSLTIANGGKVSLGKTTYIYNEHSGADAHFDNSTLGNLYLASQHSGVGTLNIGAAEGEKAQATGTLETEKIMFGDGDGTVVFNHSNIRGDYTFDTRLVSGNGTSAIRHLNGVTRFETAQTEFTGQTQVIGGTLVANSILGGTVDVSNAGTLAGSGTVGKTTVASGGTISPGQYGSSSPAVLTVDGDFIMHKGATYSVNIIADSTLSNPYASDRLVINGDAYLNGASVKANAAGDFTLYQPESRWHILSATGNVNGQFGQLTVMPFINMGYEYDPQNVYLVITRNNTHFCSTGMSYNQCSTGTNIENQGGGLIYDVIASQTSLKDAQSAFDRLSGEIHASAKGAMIEDSRFLREAVNQHLLSPSESDGAWVHAFGSWGTFSGDGNASSLERNIGGLFLGVDSYVDESWTFGLMGGFSKSTIKSKLRDSIIDRNDYHLGTYAGAVWENFALRSTLGYTWHNLSGNRYIDIPGLQDRLKSDYKAATLQAFIEGSYQFSLNDALSVAPYVNAAYVRTHTDHFDEKGGIAKLSSSTDSSDMFYSTFGARFTHLATLNDGQTVETWGTLGWRYAFNSVTPRSYMRFDGYNSFNIRGTPIDKRTAIIELGTQYTINQDIKIGFTYNGQLGDSIHDHGVKTYLNWSF